MKKVKLHGDLKEKFAPGEFSFNIKTPLEALRALNANFKGFNQYLLSQNFGYRVIVDQDEIENVDSLKNPFASEVHIVPVIQGAGGSPTARILIGAALVYASAGTATPLLGSTFLSSVVSGVGMSMLIGGAYSILFPLQSVSQQGSTDNTPSYNFNGPVNTTRQGAPVPILYGRAIVGSTVISAGIQVTDVSIGMTGAEQFYNYINYGIKP